MTALVNSQNFKNSLNDAGSDRFSLTTQAISQSGGNLENNQLPRNVNLSVSTATDLSRQGTDNEFRIERHPRPIDLVRPLAIQTPH